MGKKTGSREVVLRMDADLHRIPGRKKPCRAGERQQQHDDERADEQSEFQS